MGSLLSGKRSERPTTDDAILVRMPELRRSGLLRAGELTRVRRAWQDAGEVVGEFTITIDLREFVEPSMCINGEVGGAKISQRLLLTACDQPLGGVRWYATCPRTARHCHVLAMPPGETTFASVAGWGLAYQSTREPPAVRAHRAARKAQERFDALPRRARWSTRLAAMRERCKLTSAAAGADTTRAGELG